MSLYTTLYIGPVQGIGYNLEPAWASAPTPQGTRGASIRGSLRLAQAEQLSELVANGARRVTIGGETGVLEYVYFDGGVTREFNGWYLLQAFSFDPYRVGDTVQYAHYSLSAVHLGAHRQVVITRSDRDRVNSYSLTPSAIVADPFTGGGFVRSPGGTLVQREFDPEPHDPARVVADSAVMNVYLNPTDSTILAAP